jgi:hypothetical protein
MKLKSDWTDLSIFANSAVVLKKRKREKEAEKK